MSLLPPALYLPAAILVFLVAASFVRRITKPPARALLAGFLAAMLFGGAGVSLGHGGAFLFPVWMAFVKMPWGIALLFVLPWLAIQTAAAAAIFFLLDRLWPRGALREEWRRTVREVRGLDPPATPHSPTVRRALFLPLVPLLVAGAVIAIVIVKDMSRQHTSGDIQPAEVRRSVPARFVEEPTVEWREVHCPDAVGVEQDSPACDYQLLIQTGTLVWDGGSPPAPTAGTARVSLVNQPPEGTHVLVVNNRTGEQFHLSYGDEASIAFEQGDRIGFRTVLSQPAMTLPPDNVPLDVGPRQPKADQ